MKPADETPMPQEPPESLAELVAASGAGDAKAAHHLFSILYNELHRLARHEVARLGSFTPLGATTLLHEAFLDISRREALAFPDRARFMAYAARAMRGLVIDRVRERQAQKRGGLLDITSLDVEIADRCPQPELLSQISEALEQLALIEPTLAHVVDLKFFCGFSMLEISEMLGCSERTVQRQWEKARLLLFKMIEAS